MTTPIVARTGASLALVLAVALAPHEAAAHAGEHAGGGLAAGFIHPFTGLDHVLAMVAIGLAAGLSGGRALWALPAGFLAFMALGGGLAFLGVPFDHAEIGIALSVALAGLLVAVAPARRPVWAGLAVAAFAVFHGYAHGSELPAALDAAGYAAGGLAATAVLHFLGIVIGVAAKAAPLALLRGAGAAIAFAGVALLVPA